MLQEHLHRDRRLGPRYPLKYRPLGPHYRGGLTRGGDEKRQPLAWRGWGRRLSLHYLYPLQQAVRPTTEAARQEAAMHAAALSLARLRQAASLRYPLSIGR